MKCAASLVAVALVMVVVSDLAGLVDLPGLSRAHAQTGGGPSALLGTGYDLTWNTVDNGGDMFNTGRGYSLGGTIGQPDAGAWSGGGYTLAGGFWGGEAAHYGVYLPVVLRGP